MRCKAAARKSGPLKDTRFGFWLKMFIKGPYARVVSLCVNWRYAVLTIGLVMLLLCYGVWQAAEQLHVRPVGTEGPGSLLVEISARRPLLTVSVTV